MTENFPILVKEIDIQVQEAQRDPNKLDPKRNTQKHITVKMPKVNDKERILREKSRELPTKEFPKNYQLISQKKHCRQEGNGKKYSKSGKARTYIRDYSMQQSFHLEWKGT